MKKKAKQKEESKEIVIEWYGQINPVVPAENKKNPIINKEPILEIQKPLKQSLEEIKPKKSFSYEIIDRRDIAFQFNNQDILDSKNDENEKFEDLFEDKKEKPREKWSKSNEEMKNLEKNEKMDYKSDDYIEQMINELQEIVF